MTVVEIQFPAGGRLHATPWGRHVNEGATEWPISPWRIQRALVATWYLKARDEISAETISALSNSLAHAAPSFELPAAIQSHTRHYMPGRGMDKPKVFDTFIQSDSPIRIAWDVDLNEAERNALGTLCERLGYLGRAESIVEATLLSAETSITANSTELGDGVEVAKDCELVRVLCPARPSDHSSWLAANQPKEESNGKGKKSKGKRAEGNLPASIFEALHAETALLQSQGWLIPPGSRWVDYTRRVTCFEPGSRPKRKSKGLATVARFAVSSSVQPRITQAISVAERLHQMLAKFSDGKSCASIFTGKDATGQPLGQHRHTHIFCEIGAKRDSIGFITLYAPDGYSPDAQEVIEDVQRAPLWGHGGHDLDLTLLGFGNVEDFDIPIFGESSEWTSLTPFVPTCHAKHYADGRPKLDADGWPIGSPAQDLRRLIKRELGITPKSVSLPSPHITIRTQRTLRTLQFQTRRKYGEGRHGHQSGVGLTIEFDQAVRGPLSFGYGSHFGLGLFIPVF